MLVVRRALRRRIAVGSTGVREKERERELTRVSGAGERGSGDEGAVVYWHPGTETSRA